MTLLVLGLVLFLTPHSIRILDPGMRDRLVTRIGEGPFKGLYSILSLAGLVLLVFGYGAARDEAPLLWVAPNGLRHLTLLIVPVALGLVAAAYTPPGYIKRTVRHPMVAGVALWALAHLLANGTLADLVLFGAFLAWAVLDYVAAIRRDPHPTKGPVRPFGDLLAIGVGAMATVALFAGGHRWLFGVAPVA